MIYKGIDRWSSPYLEHHGVKGMKWGVRKAQQTTTGRRHRFVESAGRFSKEKIMYGRSVNDSHKIWNSKKIGPHIEYAIDILGERDNNRDRYMSDVSYGRAVLRRLVLGKTKSQNYNKLRAAGYDKKSSRKLMSRNVSDISERELEPVRKHIHNSILARAAIEAYKPKMPTGRDPYYIGYEKAFKKGSGMDMREVYNDKTNKWRNRYITMK